MADGDCGSLSIRTMNSRRVMKRIQYICACEISVAQLIFTPNFIQSKCTYKYEELIELVVKCECESSHVSFDLASRKFLVRKTES